MSKLTIIAACCILLPLCCGKAKASEVVDSVRRAHEERDAFVCKNSQSFDVKIRIAEVIEYLPNKVQKKYLESTWTQRRFGEMWRSERVWTNPTSSAEVFVSAAPRIVVCKDELIFDWDDDVQAAMVMPFSEPGKTNWHSALASRVYFPMIGVDSHRYLVEDMGADFTAVKTSNLYKNTIEPYPIARKLDEDGDEYVTNQTALPAGAPAVELVQKGFDTIWCDPARGYALVKRRYNWGLDKPVRYEIQYSDFKHIDQFWFPMTVHLLEYANYFKDPQDWHGKLKKSVLFKVDQLTFNSLSANDVDDLDLPAGTEVVDTARGSVYRVSNADADPFSGDSLKPYEGLASRIRLLTVTIVGFFLVIITIFVSRRTGKH